MTHSEILQQWIAELNAMITTEEFNKYYKCLESAKSLIEHLLREQYPHLSMLDIFLLIEILKPIFDENTHLSILNVFHTKEFFCNVIHNM